MPMSEDGLQWARKQARGRYEYPDDRLAIADLLKRWGIPLEMTPKERRIQLRLNQSQSWLAQSLTTIDQTTPTSAVTIDREQATHDDFGDRDDQPPPDNDDDFYAETWETLT